MEDVTEVIHRITYEVNDEALKKQYEQIVKLSGGLSKLSGYAGKSGAAATGMSKAFGKAFSKANWVGLALDAAGALTDFAKESIQAALAAEDVKIAFNNLNKPDLLDNLRPATRGAVSDVELMQAVLNANNMGLPVDTLAISMQYAQQQARLTGESVDDLTRRIQVGLSTKSPEILNNMGIDVQRINEKFAETGDYATAAAAVINEQLQQSGGALRTYGDNINILGTLWDNFKVKAGEALLEAGNAIGKQILMDNPSLQLISGLDLGTIEIQEIEKASYDKRKELLHKYIRDYNSGDSQQRSRLINNATNLYAKLQDMEADAREKGLTAQANNFQQLLLGIDDFFKQTIDKTVEQSKKTLNALLAEKRELDAQFGKFA